MPSTKLVTVEWRDSCSLAGHRTWWLPSDLDNVEDDDLTPLIKTTGYLVRKTPSYLVVAMGICADNSSFSDPFVIPRGCVERVRRTVVQ